MGIAVLNTPRHRWAMAECPPVARVAHFPEGALSGYAGTDFESFAWYEPSRRR